tara:strand:+ start:407 stop:553 length:147 start_codon:yes stop_codon:yes gene_type:complete
MIQKIPMIFFRKNISNQKPKKKDKNNFPLYLRAAFNNWFGSSVGRAMD